MSLSWPAGGIAPLIFISWIPLLLIEDRYYNREPHPGRGFFFLSVYVTFFTFNLLTTWWVKYASLFGAISAIVLNALFMAIVFYLFHIVRVKTNGKTGYLSLFAFWITFEYLHMDWDLSWPWLTIGNVFAGWVSMIQWYEVTGVLGGTLWVLAVNVTGYQIFRSLIYERQKLKKYFVATVLLIIIPVGFSICRYHTYEEIKDPVKVAVIQPNIDPYNEKFDGLSPDEQLARILQLASTVTDSTTDYVVAPETALPQGMWEEELDHHKQTRQLKMFLEPYSSLRWVIGLASNSLYPDSNKRSATARRFTNEPLYYDSYNTAMQLDKNGNIQLHHKSKLVPGVEKMPFPSVFRHLDNFAIDLGGMTGSLGMQDTPSVFKGESGHLVAPVICYESVYGEYLAEYIRQGASMIFIITNDGWWSDTPGYKQHLEYATLRAIEARRSIARSANTGISCFINQRGDILQPTKWWVPDAITATINANQKVTFYVRYGDYIGKTALVITGLIVIFIFIRKYFK